MSTQGYGNGDKTKAYAHSRKRNNGVTCTGFRPRIENEAAYYVIKLWCEHPDINVSFSALINSLLQGIKIATQQTTEINPQTNQVSIELNLGRVTIKQ
jgi:hypothetical protein